MAGRVRGGGRPGSPAFGGGGPAGGGWPSWGWPADGVFGVLTRVVLEASAPAADLVFAGGPFGGGLFAADPVPAAALLPAAFGGGEAAGACGWCTNVSFSASCTAACCGEASVTETISYRFGD